MLPSHHQIRCPGMRHRVAVFTLKRTLSQSPPREGATSLYPAAHVKKDLNSTPQPPPGCTPRELKARHVGLVHGCSQQCGPRKPGAGNGPDASDRWPDMHTGALHATQEKLPIKRHGVPAREPWKPREGAAS